MKPPSALDKLGPQDGQALVVIAVMMTTFVMFLALALDAGYLYAQRRLAQRAADAAAQAGAVSLKTRGVTQAITDTYRYAAENGFPNDGVNDWVTVNLPPVSPPAQRAYDSNYVQVVVTKTFSSFFAPILNIFDFRVSATAVAYAGQVNTYVLFVLNRTANSAMQISSNTQVHVTGGSIMVDSSSPSALDVSGVITSTNRIDVVGGQIGSGTTIPIPVTGARVVPDPLSGTPRPLWDSVAQQFKLPPDYGTYSPVITHQQGGNTVGTAAKPDLYQPSGDTTLSPGTYFGGIKISATGTYTFAPGLYIFAGGGITLLSGDIIANDVMLYNTNDPASPTGAGAYGPIDLGGNAALNIAAPETGIYRGLLMFQDPANTRQFSMAGGSGLAAAGTIYLPTATAVLGGGGGGVSFTANAQFVVDQLKLAGSNTININLDRRYDPPGFTLQE